MPDQISRIVQSTTKKKKKDHKMEPFKECMKEIAKKGKKDTTKEVSKEDLKENSKKKKECTKETNKEDSKENSKKKKEGTKETNKEDSKENSKKKKDLSKENSRDVLKAGNTAGPDHAVEVKKGPLIVLPRGLLVKFPKQKKTQFYCLFSKRKFDKARLQQYSCEEQFINNKYTPDHMLLSSDIVSVVALQDEEHPSLFVIQCRGISYFLQARDDDDRREWMHEIQIHLMSNDETPTLHQEVPVPQTFQVRISLETQNRIGDDSPVDLVVETEAITIIARSGMRLAKWPYDMIRRHSIDKGQFIIETGRLAEHGEGTFVFETNKPEDIRSVVKAAKRMQKSMNKAAPEAVQLVGAQRPLQLPPSRETLSYDKHNRESEYEPVDVQRETTGRSKPFLSNNPKARTRTISDPASKKTSASPPKNANMYENLYERTYDHVPAGSVTAWSIQNKNDARHQSVPNALSSTPPQGHIEQVYATIQKNSKKVDN